MDCPVCNGVMVVAERRRIEVDYCTKCSGIWLDAGELELLLESTGLKESGVNVEGFMSLPQEASPERPRRCPICNKKMNKVSIGSDPRVLIDVCSIGDGLWFDGGEFNRVIAQFPGAVPDNPTDQTKLISFLADLFKSGQ